MRTTIETLLAAQQTLFAKAPSTPEHQAVLSQLRDKVPAPLLAHFLRLVQHGRKGVGLVRNGVCSGCHLRLPSGVAVMLRQPGEVHVCDNCGCYLLLPDDEVQRVTVRTAPTVAAVRKPRQAERALAV